MKDSPPFRGSDLGEQILGYVDRSPYEPRRGVEDENGKECPDC
jgi:hypothetical protein